MKIRPRILATIWRKELSETLRDRRTLFIMIVLPLLLYPLLLIGFTRLMQSESEAALARESIVAVWGELPPRLVEEVANRPHLRLRPWLGAPAGVRGDLEAGRLAAPAKRVIERLNDRPRDPDVDPETEELPNAVLDAARTLVTSRGVDAVLAAWRDGAFSIYFDSVREESSLARTRLDRALDAYRARLVSTPVDASARDVAEASRQAGRIIGTVLPYLLLTLCIMGGLYPAIDLTAGEKERGTMQTLMCAPVLPGEIIGGKFLAVWTLSLASAAANVVSLATTLTRTLPVDGATIPVVSYALTALILVPITLLTSAVFLAIAVFAKDFKEGQSFLMPVYMALSLPAMVTMVPTITLNAWTTFVPIVNIALLIKALLIAEAHGDLVFLTLLSSGIYAALGLLLAVRVFGREQVLVGGRESMRDIFALARGARIPSPSLALVMFAVVVVAAFYGTLSLEPLGVMRMLLVMQLAFFLLPCVALAVAWRMDLRETFSLRAPRPAHIVIAVVLGATTWAFASGVLLRLAPPPDSLVRALERILMLRDERMPLWVVWLVIGIVPAICEEALFRGFILSGLRPLGAVAAIGISALLFGLAHASIYRLLPTLFLGIVLGVLVWRSGSLLTSITMHAINNSFLATLTEYRPLARAIGLDQTANALPWPHTIAGSLVAAAAFWLFLSMSDGGMFFVRKRTDPHVVPGSPPPATN